MLGIYQQRLAREIRNESSPAACRGVIIFQLVSDAPWERLYFRIMRLG